MSNSTAKQHNRRTRRSTAQEDFDPRQMLPSTAPRKRQSVYAARSAYRSKQANEVLQDESRTEEDFDPRQTLPATAPQKRWSTDANSADYRSSLATAARPKINRAEVDFDPTQVLGSTAFEKQQRKNDYIESHRGHLKNTALQTEPQDEEFFDPASMLPSSTPEKRWNINAYDIAYHDILKKAARDSLRQTPTVRRHTEEPAARPSFGKLAYDSFAAGAGTFNRGVLNGLGMMADDIKEIERQVFGSDAFSGSLLDPTVGRAVDYVNTQADAVEKQAQKTAEDYGPVGPYVKGAIKEITERIPAAIAAIGTGGASSAAQLLGENPTWWSRFLQLTTDLMANPIVIANAVPRIGNTYRDDREKGIPINMATAHAFTDGAISSIITAGTPDVGGRAIASKLSDRPAMQKYIADVHDFGASDALEGTLNRLTGRLSGSNEMGIGDILNLKEIASDYVKGAFTEAAIQTGSLKRDIEWEKAQLSANAKVSETLQAAGIRKPADNMDISGYNAALADAGERQSWNLIYSDLLADSFPSATIRPQTGSYQSTDFSGHTQAVGLDIPPDEAVRKENLTNLLWNEIEASVKGKAWSDLMNRIPHGDFQRLQQYPELRKAYQNVISRTIKSAHQRSQRLPSGGIGARVNRQFVQDILSFYA